MVNLNEFLKLCTDYRHCGHNVNYFYQAAALTPDITFSLVNRTAVVKKTGLPHIRAVINDRKLALFGHVRCLPEGTPAHDILHVSVESHAGMVAHPGWRRKPGRPQRTWLRDVLKATCLTAREAWTAADDREW